MAGVTEYKGRRWHTVKLPQPRTNSAVTYVPSLGRSLMRQHRTTCIPGTGTRRSKSTWPVQACTFSYFRPRASTLCIARVDPFINEDRLQRSHDSETASPGGAQKRGRKWRQLRHTCWSSHTRHHSAYLVQVPSCPAWWPDTLTAYRCSGLRSPSYF